VPAEKKAAADCLHSRHLSSIGVKTGDQRDGFLCACCGVTAYIGHQPFRVGDSGAIDMYNSRRHNSVNNEQRKCGIKRGG